MVIKKYLVGLASRLIQKQLYKKGKINIKIHNFSKSLPLTKQIYFLSFYLNPVLEKIYYINIKGFSSKKLIDLKNFDYKSYNFLSDEVIVSESFLNKFKSSSRFNNFSLINISTNKYKFGFNYNLDVYSNKDATGEMINLSNRFFSQQEVVEGSKSRYITDVVTKNKSDKILLLGSGPSVDNFDFNKYSDYDIMICNSLVISKNISELNNLKYIVFGDPIFHSGPAKYPGIFRKTLVRNYQNKDVKILTPSRDYLIYKHYLPNEIFNKMYFFEVKQEKFNYNLDKSFYVNATQNILTLAMLPFAMNNYKKIFFAGFDGNNNVKKNYYWKHSEKYQFQKELNDIKNIHPGFFKLDFNEYNEDHNKVLQSILDLESGVSFKNLTDSSIPALQEIT
jgi:hypothetical protein